jgi:hypothetical protein
MATGGKSFGFSRSFRSVDCLSCQASTKRTLAMPSLVRQSMAALPGNQTGCF